MTSKNPEKTKKTQSKLSFYEKFFTKPVKNNSDTPKETTEPKTNTSQNEVNNNNLILFPENTFDMEVDTTISQQPETQAESSTLKSFNTTTATLNVNED